MKKRILLPTDFSKNSMNAINYTIRLFQDEECDFYILNCYETEPSSMEIMVAYNLEEIQKKSDRGLDRILRKYSGREYGENHKFYKVSNSDSLIASIKNLVELKDIYMVIMGTKGTTNAREQIYGSNTVNTMEKVRNCPVLAIPENSSFKGIKEIVFASSLKTHVKIRELKYLIDLAQMSGAAIRILNAAKDEDALTKEQQNNKALMKEYFEEIDHSFHTLSNKDVHEAINAFVESRNSDMVAFINKKHNFFGSILTRPMVKKLGYHSKIPVLAMHDLRN
jgi:nucleotide-binding universal stress UspA family protein